MFLLHLAIEFYIYCFILLPYKCNQTSIQNNLSLICIAKDPRVSAGSLQFIWRPTTCVDNVFFLNCFFSHNCRNSWCRLKQAPHELSASVKMKHSQLIELGDNVLSHILHFIQQCLPSLASGTTLAGGLASSRSSTSRFLLRRSSWHFFRHRIRCLDLVFAGFNHRHQGHVPASICNLFELYSNYICADLFLKVQIPVKRIANDTGVSPDNKFICCRYWIVDSDMTFDRFSGADIEICRPVFIIYKYSDTENWIISTFGSACLQNLSNTFAIIFWSCSKWYFCLYSTLKCRKRQISTFCRCRILPGERHPSSPFAVKNLTISEACIPSHWFGKFLVVWRINALFCRLYLAHVYGPLIKCCFTTVPLSLIRSGYDTIFLIDAVPP